MYNNRYTTVPPELILYAEREAAATSIRSFCIAVPHGLLQTAVTMDHIWDDAVMAKLEAQELRHLRVARQDTFQERGPKPKVQIILGERALRGCCNTPSQLNRLRQATQQGMEILVLPNDSKTLADADGSFTILRGTGEQGPWSLVEGYAAGATHLNEDPAVALRYDKLFDSLYALAVPVDVWLASRTA